MLRVVKYLAVFVVNLDVAHVQKNIANVYHLSGERCVAKKDNVVYVFYNDRVETCAVCDCLVETSDNIYQVCDLTSIKNVVKKACHPVNLGHYCLTLVVSEPVAPLCPVDRSLPTAL